MTRNRKIRVIIDTNIFFSSIFFPNGNERRLLELADRGMWQIIVCDYVLEEIQLVLERKGINPELALNLLDTYRNIIHMGMGPEAYHDIRPLASELVSDRKDWPMFVFAKLLMENHGLTFLVSGDSDLNSEQVRKALYGRAMRAREFLEIMKAGRGE